MYNLATDAIDYTYYTRAQTETFLICIGLTVALLIGSLMTGGNSEDKTSEASD